MAPMRCGVLLATAVATATMFVSSPAKALAAGSACGAATVPVSTASAWSVAAYKAAHDTLHLPAERLAAVRAGAVSCATAAGSGRVVLSGLDQQGQVTPYYCGPATVSEMAWSRGLPVDQGTAGSWMGTDPNSGTSVEQLTAGLNHFVAAPAGGSYAFASMAYYPTADERSAFVARLRWDLTTYGGWPVAGDAWEVPGGPHLIGHPDLEIFHWIEIGGLDDGDAAVYYADSATTVWSGVPAYSWIDTGSLETILGGRGYDW
jgi:hypothetical protein